MANQDSSTKKPRVIDQHQSIAFSHDKPRAAVGRGVGLKFAQAYFPEATERLRIASGYFYVSGYDQTRDSIGKGVNIQILVGKDEAPRKDKLPTDRPKSPTSAHLANAIANEILRELGQTPTELYESVKDIADRIRAKTFQIWDARQVKYSHLFHVKYYISDTTCMWSGSANFTKPALCSNTEQVKASYDADEVGMFIEHFDAEIAVAEDILEFVRACLQGWLDMVSPFHAYLKVLHAFFDLDSGKVGKGGNYPAYYQQEVIHRAVEQIRDYQGALLVIGTGLGKTVIGAEIARRLLANPFDEQIVLLAPQIVAKSWSSELNSRRLSHDMFDIGLLFRNSSETRTHAVSRLLRRLDRCDTSTILIIDEAHYYKNMLLRDYTLEKENKRRDEQKINLVRTRLTAAVGKGAQVLLLTATPYGANRQNVSSLLNILPPTAPNVGLLQEAGHWCITNLSEVLSLPVVTTLSMGDLLRLALRQKDVEEDGRIFIAFPGDRKSYLPRKILLRRVSYSLFLEEVIQPAFAEGIFNAKPMPMTTFCDSGNKNISIAADVVRNNALRSWLGSPLEMRRFLLVCCEKPDTISSSTDTASLFTSDVFTGSDGSNDISGGVIGSLANSQENRKKKLMPIYDRIDAMSFVDDKLVRLREIIIEHFKKKNKIIVFVDRRATAYYLKEQLTMMLHEVRIKCTVRKSGSDKYQLLTLPERENAIHCFSPKSNKIENLPLHEELDLLICTDADGIGVNMQDACVVVNYDLPYTADEMFQRAGRILRMTDDPERNIFLYTFVPVCQDSTSATANIIQSLLTTLKDRHDKSTALLWGKVLAGEDEEISIATEQDISKFVQLTQSPIDNPTPEPRSEKDGHIAFLHRHIQRVAEIAIVTLSARYYNDSEARIVVLLEFEQKPALVCYNIATEQLEQSEFLSILNTIRCENESETCALVSAKTVERESIKAMNAWLAFHNKTDDDNQCTRVCAIYLTPRRELKKDLPQMFRDEKHAAGLP